MPQTTARLIVREFREKGRIFEKKSDKDVRIALYKALKKQRLEAERTPFELEPEEKTSRTAENGEAFTCYPEMAVMPEFGYPTFYFLNPQEVFYVPINEFYYAYQMI